MFSGLWRSVMVSWLLSVMLVVPCPACGMQWLASAVAAESTATVASDCDCCGHEGDEHPTPVAPGHKPGCACHTLAVPTLQQDQTQVSRSEFVALGEVDLPQSLLPVRIQTGNRSIIGNSTDLARSSPIRQ